MVRGLNILAKARQKHNFLKKKIEVLAPAGYAALTAKEKNEICNGCGAKDGFKVPKWMWGLDMSESCNIHDYMFEIGRNLDDWKEANEVFMENMKRIIHARSCCWPLVALRMRRAKKYSWVVNKLSKSAFWANKQHLKGVDDV